MLAIWYGGTFDPVHNGHLAIARAAADAFGVPVTLAPAADPPHRAATGAAAEPRARMLDLAVAGDARLRVDRRELRRPGPSWTVDTLRELRAERGGDVPLALLLGADSFRSLPTWRDWRRLPALAHFIVAERSAGGLDNLPPVLAAEFEGRWAQAPADLAASAAGRVFRLRQPLRGESATAVRRAIAADDPAWPAQMPAAVAGWIRAHGLYRAS
ncbi:nicotinic acid mononucleotide adenylyltransferase [Pseudoxanthomonas broegbernensis]|uniref:Probable nicotinate-nucleotide adenylyltransferase n=1 Tax=Pseudoxanthomonas broegbernensis TaxID=83619 RepID=A0A7V8K6N6_9GAMM|nr:nicotinate-nucleotide adenylyltransferase [Pseudoxanthomonas broegbernensis]KAF1685429.1 nicotinic acid mononucleotide adenylyltransferase [Pseudoxanthomonas broegbernensis]